MSAAVTAAPAAAIRIAGVSRVFGETRAVDDASFAVGQGEIVGLVGHNGAGKSTVAKIIAGLDSADAGAIEVGGEAVSFGSARDAMAAGVGLVPQRLAVVPSLSVGANLVLGQHRGGRSSQAEVRAVAERLGIDPVLNRSAEQIRPSVQRLIMIGRTLLRQPRLLILDEPTAAFSLTEVARLFEIMRELKRDGIGIIFVSHRLEEVLEISDRVVAMSRGRVIADKPAAELGKAELVDLIAGRHVEHLSGADAAASNGKLTGEAALALRDVTVAPRLREINLEVGRGEIVGLTGLVGSGRSRLLNAIWGIGSPIEGSITVDGKAFKPSTPRAALRRGIAYLPENRARNSLFKNMSVAQNVTLPTIKSYRRGPTPLIDRSGERRRVQEVLDQLSVHPANSSALPIGGLSGGNQQKSLIARWLMLDAEIYLFDEPTEGVDVGGKGEIYAVMRGLAEAGKSVLVSSSDIEEIVDQCSRVYVMRGGTTAPPMTGAEITLEGVSRACLA